MSFYDKQFRGLTIDAFFSGGHAHFWSLNPERVEPNIVYVNEMRKIPTEQRQTISIPPNTPQGVRYNLVYEHERKELMRKIRWEASPLLVGAGFLVHPSLFAMKIGRYLELEERMSGETVKKVKEVNKVVGKIIQGKASDEELYAARKSIPVIELAHRFLNVAISDGGLEGSVLRLSPVFEDHDYVGYKDYNLHYVAGGKVVPAEKVVPPNINHVVPIHFYRFPFNLENADGVELCLPDDGIKGIVKVTPMQRRPAKVVFTDSFIRDLQKLLSGDSK